MLSQPVLAVSMARLPIDRMMKRLTEGLSLTAQQQAEIEPIVARACGPAGARFAHQVEVEQILTRAWSTSRPSSRRPNSLSWTVCIKDWKDGGRLRATIWKHKNANWGRHDAPAGP
jgi:hypothetical protein